MVRRYRSELGLTESQYKRWGSAAGTSYDLHSLDKAGTLLDLPMSEAR